MPLRDAAGHAAGVAQDDVRKDGALLLPRERIGDDGTLAVSSEVVVAANRCPRREEAAVDAQQLGQDRGVAGRESRVILTRPCSQAGMGGQRAVNPADAWRRPQARDFLRREASAPAAFWADSG